MAIVSKCWPNLNTHYKTRSVLYSWRTAFNITNKSAGCYSSLNTFYYHRIEFTTHYSKTRKKNIYYFGIKSRHIQIYRSLSHRRKMHRITRRVCCIKNTHTQKIYLLLASAGIQLWKACWWKFCLENTMLWWNKSEISFLQHHFWNRWHYHQNKYGQMNNRQRSSWVGNTSLTGLLWKSTPHSNFISSKNSKSRRWKLPYLFLIWR